MYEKGPFSVLLMLVIFNRFNEIICENIETSDNQKNEIFNQKNFLLHAKNKSTSNTNNILSKVRDKRNDKETEDELQLGYETFEPCNDGFITMDRFIGLPFEEENYYNATAHLKKYKGDIPHAEIDIILDNAATISVDYKEARVRVLEDKTFYIRTYGLPPTLNFTVRAPALKPFPNLKRVALNQRILCVNPKKWSPTLQGPSAHKDEISVRFLEPEEEAPLHSCGRRQIDQVALVTNSQETEAGDWPWHVAIFKKSANLENNKYQCGGTILSKTTIITAAHCCVERGRPIAAERLTVIVGKYHLNLTDSNSKELQVDRVIIHNRFNPRNYKNDIALFKLTRDIMYNDFVQPICLWTFKKISKTYLFGEIGTLVGWGSLKPNSSLSDTLRSGSMELVSDTTCLLSLTSFFQNFVSDDTFCAGNGPEDGTSACNGDSGGALIFNITLRDGEPTWFLRGIVSISVTKKRTNPLEVPTCDPRYYNVFTDSARYLSWIYGHTDDLDTAIH